MYVLFRSQHPLTVALLFCYGILLRTAAFLSPLPPVRTTEDGYIYGLMADGITEAFRSVPVLYALTAYVFVFLQALLLNAQMDRDKLLPRTGFLPAMTYLLLTALLPEWWVLSPVMISAILMIRIWGDMNRVFNASRPGNIVFNAGVLLGISALIHFPSMLFGIFVLFAPAIMGTPRLRDWVSGLVGLLMPFYFFLSWMYLSSRWVPGRVLPGLRIEWPRLDLQPLVWISLILLSIPFLWGVAVLNRQLPRMLIRNRKIWTLLYGFLAIGLLMTFWGGGKGLSSAFAALIPMAAFHSIVYEQNNRPLWPRLLHLTFIFAILGWNYLVLTK